MLNGKAAFRSGDTTRHCGGAGRLIEGSDNVDIGSGGSGAAGGGGKASTPTSSDSEEHAFKGGFELRDKSTGEPLRGRRYRLCSASGYSVEGATDDKGRTQLLSTPSEEELDLELLDEEPELNFIDPQFDRAEHDFDDEEELGRAFVGGFALRDESTGEPLRGRRYRLRSASGHSVEGITDDHGCTQLLTTSNEEQLEIELLCDEPELNFIDPVFDREVPDFEEE